MNGRSVALTIIDGRVPQKLVRMGNIWIAVKLNKGPVQYTIPVSLTTQPVWNCTLYFPFDAISIDEPYFYFTVNFAGEQAIEPIVLARSRVRLSMMPLGGVEVFSTNIPLVNSTNEPFIKLCMKGFLTQGTVTQSPQSSSSLYQPCQYDQYSGPNMTGSMCSTPPNQFREVDAQNPYANLPDFVQ